VPLLYEKEINCMVLEKKEHDLLSKYTSEDLKEEQVEACYHSVCGLGSNWHNKVKAMLNIQH